LYRKALKVRRNSLGDNHPDVAASLHNLADFYTLQGRYDEAELYWRQALDIANQVLGTEHPDTHLYSNCLQGIPMFRNLPRALVKDILQKAHPKNLQGKSKKYKDFFNEYRHFDARRVNKKRPKGFMIEIRENRDILENPDFYSHLVPVAKKIFHQLGSWIKKQAVEGYQQLGKGIVLVEIQNSYDEIQMSYVKQANCIKASKNAPSEVWDSVLMYLDIYNPKDYFIVLIVDQLENPGTNTCHHYMLPL
jgi:tetratricopeptide (TPR) repeat protein